ncbi:MAG: Interferon-induced GTP-binding protein Mx1 [Vezdaea aestivalis]|nr:MAG: Interferon-induced GTP-binding protein Mx1 [Vezdaea aestivalis]
MLMVILANVDIATQEILSMAEEVDKDGDRTLGVLSKLELVDKGAEKQIMDLLAGK